MKVLSGWCVFTCARAKFDVLRVLAESMPRISEWRIIALAGAIHFTSFNSVLHSFFCSFVSQF